MLTVKNTSYDCRVGCLMNYTIRLPVLLTEFMKVTTFWQHCLVLSSWWPYLDGFRYNLNLDVFGTALGIAIGGDVFPGSTLSDHVLRFNNIPQVNYCLICSF